MTEKKQSSAHAQGADNRPPAVLVYKILDAVYRANGSTLNDGEAVREAITKTLAAHTPAESEPPNARNRLAARDKLIETLEAENARLREDLEALRAAPTKEEVELRLEVARLRKEADTAHAEVVHTQDELGALLHAAEAKLAQALSQVEDATTRFTFLAKDYREAAGIWRRSIRGVHDSDKVASIYERIADTMDACRVQLTSTMSAPDRPDWCQGADPICHHPACTCVFPPQERTGDGQ